MLGAAQALKIFERAVFVIAVLPPDPVAFRDRAVRVLPNAPVNKLPICAVRADAGIRLIRDLANEIAIRVELHSSDRQPVMLSRAGPLAFLELRLAHAPRRPSRSP